jgi:hypothetical protein
MHKPDSSQRKPAHKKPEINLTRNKPYEDWKDERLYLRTKWGEQGRPIPPPTPAPENKA